MSDLITIQATTIAMLEKANDDLRAKNRILDKRCKEIFGEYQTLQYDIRGLPTMEESVMLKLKVLELEHELAAYKEFDK